MIDSLNWLDLENVHSQNIHITYIFYELLSWVCATQFVVKQEFKSQYVYNKHNTPWKVCVYSIYALVGLYQKYHSFAALTHSITDIWTTHA